MVPGPEDNPDPDDEEPDDDGDDGDDDGDDGGNSATSPASLSSMTKAQLIDYAEEHGVQGVSSDMKKADIIAAIEG